MEVVGNTVSHRMFPTNSGGDQHKHLVRHYHNLKNLSFLSMPSSWKSGEFIDAMRVSNI